MSPRHDRDPIRPWKWDIYGGKRPTWALMILITHFWDEVIHPLTPRDARENYSCLN